MEQIFLIIQIKKKQLCMELIHLCALNIKIFLYKEIIIPKNLSILILDLISVLIIAKTVLI